MPDSQKQILVRFIYYGGSAELFIALGVVLIAITAYGIAYNQRFMWWCTLALERFANGVGRLFAWAGLCMVLQQTLIVFLQRIFRVAEISLGPFGTVFTKDLSWYSEELKLYNAIVVCLCCTYTFVQNGHVRVDLLYARWSYKTKRMIDMAGALFFMLPMSLVIWLYAWFFMWRHLVTPKPTATDNLDRLLMKAKALRWNIETIGFSPNGFNAYFLFKILIVLFAFMIIVHAVAVFYRAYLEYAAGENGHTHAKDLETSMNDQQTYNAPTVTPAVTS